MLDLTLFSGTLKLVYEAGPTGFGLHKRGAQLFACLS